MTPKTIPLHFGSENWSRGLKCIDDALRSLKLYFISRMENSFVQSSSGDFKSIAHAKIIYISSVFLTAK